MLYHNSIAYIQTDILYECVSLSDQTKQLWHIFIVSDTHESLSFLKKKKKSEYEQKSLFRQGLRVGYKPL